MALMGEEVPWERERGGGWDEADAFGALHRTQTEVGKIGFGRNRRRV